MRHNERTPKKFIVLNAYVKKSERSQINNLMMNLKASDKQEQIKN